jgi:hypothetical protein
MVPNQGSNVNTALGVQETGEARRSGEGRGLAFFDLRSLVRTRREHGHPLQVFGFLLELILCLDQFSLCRGAVGD